MNKKILAAACGLVMSSGFAFAHDDMNFYVGGDVGYSKLGYFSAVKDGISTDNGKIKSKVPTFGLFVGGKFHENFGTELGYTFYKKAKFNGTDAIDGPYEGDVKLNNIYVDLLGYMPIDTCFDLIGAVGAGSMKVKVKDSEAAGVTSQSKSKIGFRLGAGAQYKFDDHFAARAMVRYQKAGKKGDMEVLKNTTSINLGLTYTI